MNVDDNSGGREGSFARDVMEQFARGLAERQDFSEVVGGEVGPEPAAVAPSG